MDHACCPSKAVTTRRSCIFISCSIRFGRFASTCIGICRVWGAASAGCCAPGGICTCTVTLPATLRVEMAFSRSAPPRDSRFFASRSSTVGVCARAGIAAVNSEQVISISLIMSLTFNTPSPAG